MPTSKNFRGIYIINTCQTKYLNLCESPALEPFNLTGNNYVSGRHDIFNYIALLSQNNYFNFIFNKCCLPINLLLTTNCHNIYAFRLARGIINLVGIIKLQFRYMPQCRCCRTFVAVAHLCQYCSETALQIVYIGSE